MSLRHRLQQRNAGQKQPSLVQRDSVALPPSVVERFIRESLLMQCMGLQKEKLQDVVGTLAHLREKRGTLSSRTVGTTDAQCDVVDDDEWNAFATTPVANDAACAHEDVEVAHRDGAYVCRTCGVLLGDVRVDTPWSNCVHDAPRHHATLDAERSTIARRARALPRQECTQLHIESDVEHWAAYMGISGEELQTAKYDAVRAYRAVTMSQRVAVAAALFLPLLRHAPTAEEAERAMRAGDRLDEAEAVLPEPMFACATCHARTHTAKTARYHCSKLKGDPAVKRRRFGL